MGFITARVIRHFLFFATFLLIGFTARSETGTISAKDDYVTCWKQPCVLAAGSEWSEKNPSGVGVAVRMGISSAATDDQIKAVLIHDLKKHGVTNYRFFYEQNDAPASGIFLHVRGGTEGVFTIKDVRQNIQTIAKRALNENQLFQ